GGGARLRQRRPRPRPLPRLPQGRRPQRRPELPARQAPGAASRRRRAAARRPRRRTGVGRRVAPLRPGQGLARPRPGPGAPPRQPVPHRAAAVRGPPGRGLRGARRPRRRPGRPAAPRRRLPQAAQPRPPPVRRATAPGGDRHAGGPDAAPGRGGVDRAGPDALYRRFPAGRLAPNRLERVGALPPDEPRLAGVLHPTATRDITPARKKLILTRRASEGGPSLARRVSVRNFPVGVIAAVVRAAVPFPEPPLSQIAPPGLLTVKADARPRRTGRRRTTPPRPPAAQNRTAFETARPQPLGWCTLHPGLIEPYES